MSSKCNVVIWESQKGFSNKLREYFQSKGVTSHLSNNFKDLTKKARSLASPIIMIELPDRTNPAHQFLKDLTAQQDLFPFPLLMVGNNARSYENFLNESFKLAVNFNKPASNAEILEAIHYILDTFEFPKSGHIPTPSETISQEKDGFVPAKASEGASIQSEIIETDAVLPANELYSSFNSIPQLFFEELNKYNLLSRDLQGKQYINYASEKT